MAGVGELDAVSCPGATRCVAVGAGSEEGVTVTTGPVAITAVALSAAPSGTVAPNGSIVYSLDVVNEGQADAGSIVVDDVVPSGTTYLPGSATCGNASACSVQEMAGGGPIQWTLGALAAGSSISGLSLAVRVSAAPGTTITNQATWTGGSCEVTPSCSTNQVTNVVETPIPQATTVHTGQPWAGSGPWVWAGGCLGLILVVAEVAWRRLVNRQA